MIEPIRKLVVVPCDAATAFKIFAQQTSSWWPLEHHSVTAGQHGKPAKSVTIEPAVGGKIFETTPEGQELQWGSVIAYEPGKVLRFLWHIMEPVENATEVEVTFKENDSKETEVVLEHRNWHKLGERGQESRDHYNGGWVRVFEERFAGACNELHVGNAAGTG